MAPISPSPCVLHSPITETENVALPFILITFSISLREREREREVMGGHRIVDGEIKLEFTPTWIVALFCTVIVFVSLLVERHLHALGKFFKRKNQKPLFEALLKVKEELMLLGFISLLMTISEKMLQNICIPRHWNDYMLPCRNDQQESEEALLAAAERYDLGDSRRVLLEEIRKKRHCERGTVPLLSPEAIDQLHIFIFVLAITHVIFTVFTMILGGAKIRQWKYWEDSIINDKGNDLRSISHAYRFEFIQERVKATGKDPLLSRWLSSFWKQFSNSVSKSDYITMRFGFIMTHCTGNQNFDFHKYMVRALEADFKKVVGISWHLWIFAILFLLLNVDGWHTYFWMAFIPLALLLAVGTKLELVISQLALDVAEGHSSAQGDLVVKPSDEHFWFNSPRIMLHFIHFILFQNAFEIAHLFWIFSTFGFHSCIMGKLKFMIPRLIIGAIIQILCSYSTLPLYAIVTQMGSSFKEAIFHDHVQACLKSWAKQAKKRRNQSGSSQVSRSSSVDVEDRPSDEIQMLKLLGRKDSQKEDRGAGPSEMDGGE